MSINKFFSPNKCNELFQCLNISFSITLEVTSYNFIYNFIYHLYIITQSDPSNNRRKIASLLYYIVNKFGESSRSINGIFFFSSVYSDSVHLFYDHLISATFHNFYSAQNSTGIKYCLVKNEIIAM